MMAARSCIAWRCRSAKAGELRAQRSIVCRGMPALAAASRWLTPRRTSAQKARNIRAFSAGSYLTRGRLVMGILCPFLFQKSIKSGKFCTRDHSISTSCTAKINNMRKLKNLPPGLWRAAAFCIAAGTPGKRKAARLAGGGCSVMHRGQGGFIPRRYLRLALPFRRDNPFFQSPWGAASCDGQASLSAAANVHHLCLKSSFRPPSIYTACLDQ